MVCGESHRSLVLSQFRHGADNAREKFKIKYVVTNLVVMKAETIASRGLSTGRDQMGRRV